jgi:DDE superfamily endonuclease
VLLTRFLALLSLWRPVFRQERSFQRAVRPAVGALLVVGSATLTRLLASLGRDQQDWSADYKLHARAEWKEQALFDALLPSALAHCPGRFVPVALDDTRLRKTGKRIPTAFWQRDPLSPPFRVNLQWGLRFLQASLLLPLHRKGKGSARAVPIRFTAAPSLKKPGARAGSQEQERYREQRKQHNLSRQAVDLLTALRQSLDDAGVPQKRLLVAGDGSFCNRTLFRTPLDRIDLLCRTRADVRLCRPAPAGSRRRYDQEKFTPEQVRQNDEVAWPSSKLWHGGKRRKLRYKEVDRVLWQGGAGQRPLRLLVVAPVPYRRTPRSRLSYRRSAYLLTTDRSTPARQLLQVYLDRWEIGVSRKGHIYQLVRDQPGRKDSSLVAGEASWRESKTTEPSDNLLERSVATHQVATCSERRRSLVTRFPVAETVDHARKQQELTETSPKRQFSPAGYQRRHGVKANVSTGEALDARRRKIAEERLAITVSGKCGPRRQGGGSGRSTVEGRAAKHARREEPGPVSAPLTKVRQG